MGAAVNKTTAHDGEKVVLRLRAGTTLLTVTLVLQTEFNVARWEDQGREGR